MKKIQSLSRGLTVLELLSQSDQGLGVTELSKCIEVDKSSITRMLHTLVEHDFAMKDPNSRRYLLGPKVQELVKSSTNNLPLREQSLPILRELVDKTGENAHVAIYSQEHALVIADVESKAQLRVVSGEGRLIPNHCTAIGKCLIAFDDYPISKELPSFTPRTITSRDQLRLHLEQIRQRGYAVDDEEHEFGVRCIAVPVYDGTGRAVASMGISGPTVRVTLAKVEEYAQVIIESARELSITLGGT
ncbi:MAG: IclR family transcriptional regulator [Chloroflexota bacterium]